jgi:hypothetical protein
VGPPVISVGHVISVGKWVLMSHQWANGSFCHVSG